MLRVPSSCASVHVGYSIWSQISPPCLFQTSTLLHSSFHWHLNCARSSWEMSPNAFNSCHSSSTLGSSVCRVSWNDQSNRFLISICIRATRSLMDGLCKPLQRSEFENHVTIFIGKKDAVATVLCLSRFTIMISDDNGAKFPVPLYGRWNLHKLVPRWEQVVSLSRLERVNYLHSTKLESTKHKPIRPPSLALWPKGAQFKIPNLDSDSLF